MHTGGENGERQAWNLGQKLGLSGRASLLPLAVFALATGTWLVFTLRPAEGAE
jgi:hypothetical protein